MKINLNQYTMKKLTLLLIGILFATIAISQDRYVEWAKEISKRSIARGADDFHGLIVKQANEKWQGDYSMISYEIKKQCKAFYELFKMEKPTGMTEDTFKTIQAKAMIKWNKRDSNDKIIEADWAMVLYETKKQVKAYLEIF